MKANYLMIGLAAVAGWFVLKGTGTLAAAAPVGSAVQPITVSPASSGGGTTQHTVLQNGVTVQVPANADNVLMEKPGNPTSWIPNAAVAAYLAGGWVRV